jgi:hypothetical protein
VEELVIGVPARDAGETVASLADALQLGAARLGEATKCELVLAYQSSQDDTLRQWQSSPSRIPHRVLFCPDGVTGKGRNVKLLIRYAREAGAHLLLVDADLGAYPPANVGRFLGPEGLARAGLILPLWSRPRGQGNSTDFLACPLLYAAFGARVRQPLAGHMFLGRRLLAAIDVDRLPDDYGIDVALTMHALDRGLPVTQVALPFPEHQGGGNSHRIMADVAGAMLRRLAQPPIPDRRDVAWPARYWEHLAVPPPSARSLEGLIEQLEPTGDAGRWWEWLDRPPEMIRDFWCNEVATAVRLACRGEPIPDLLTQLAYPFLVHAEYRRRLGVDHAGAEIYVAELGERMAEALR